MLRRIVVPLDGSDFARSALPYAVALASSDTTLELVSAFDPSAYLTVTGYGGITGAPGYDAGTEVPAAAAEYTVELRRRREEELDRVAEEVRSAFDADVRWTMLDGPPAETIAEHASGEVDLMVLSTHGRGGLERAWLGSVADRLVQRSPAPLLLVRPREDHAHARALESPPRIRRVLVPLDGSRLAEAVLEPAATLADAAGAAVVLASVIPTDLMVGSPYLPHLAREREGRRGEKTREIGDYLDEVAERLRGRGVEVAAAHVAEGTPASTILQLGREHADLIAMATHGRGGLRRWLLGSVSDKVVRGGDQPVLLVRPEGNTED